MSTPHKCPVCDGMTTVKGDDVFTGGPIEQPCPACKGTGVVWEPVIQWEFESEQREAEGLETRLDGTGMGK